jgi:hypothetical protein
MKARTLYCIAGGVLLIAAGALLFSGFSKPHPTVAGTVLLDGDPLPSGWIRFVPVEGTSGPDAGAVVEEGDYTVTQGLVVGKYRVEIHGVKESAIRQERDPLTPTQLTPAEVEAVPPEYNAKSQLIHTVKPGTNTVDFPLRSSHKAK